MIFYIFLQSRKLHMFMFPHLDRASFPNPSFMDNNSLVVVLVLLFIITIFYCAFRCLFCIDGMIMEDDEEIYLPSDQDELTMVEEIDEIHCYYGGKY